MEPTEQERAVARRPVSQGKNEKMTRMHKFTLAAALLGSLAALGCSSSSNGNGGSSGGSFFCVVTTGTTQNCTGASGFSADQKKAADDACAQHGGTAVRSCPTDNQIGCCVNDQPNQHMATACYYQSSGDAGTMGGDAGPSINYEQGCTQSGGTWTTP